MLDLDAIRKRAQQASEKASAAMQKSFEKSEELIRNLEMSNDEKTVLESDQQPSSHRDDRFRQVEIAGQRFTADEMAALATSEQRLRQLMEERMSEVAAAASQNVMEQLAGDDMGLLAAALEMLDMEDEDEEEEVELDREMEQKLADVLEEILARIDALPEQEPAFYQNQDPRWERFGILLSGIVSTLNDHHLDAMEVEEHIPVMEQQIASLVRRSWGIEGRGELLTKIRQLIQEGYVQRYQLYCEAPSAQTLMDETMDDEDREAVCRAWRFAQRFRKKYAYDFIIGWDIGRAAMLTRWGYYLGWITEGEAAGILWDLSHRAAEELHSWREFAESYLFGGLLWKLLCGSGDAESYLGYLADAAVRLLTGNPQQDSGQWRSCPWPTQRNTGSFH